MVVSRQFDYSKTSKNVEEYLNLLQILEKMSDLAFHP